MDVTALEFKLIPHSVQDWIKVVLSDFDSFLINHAACERKASATGVTFVVRYPDRLELAEPMIRLAREELLHFQQVCRILRKRGLQLRPDEKDPYVNQLLTKIRSGRDEEFLDRLLVFGLIEARGAERFGAVGKALEDSDLKSFYQNLAETEARHHQLFIDLALKYFSHDQVATRLRELESLEYEAIANVPLRAAVH